MSVEIEDEGIKIEVSRQEIMDAIGKMIADKYPDIVPKNVEITVQMRQNVHGEYSMESINAVVSAKIAY